jgi:hypothetical protein
VPGTRKRRPPPAEEGPPVRPRRGPPWPPRPDPLTPEALAAELRAYVPSPWHEWVKARLPGAGEAPGPAADAPAAGAPR